MSCDLSVRGFNTKAALKSHTRLYHGKATDEPAPILRRKKAMQLKKAALEKEDFEAAGNALAELDLERLPGQTSHGLVPQRMGTPIQRAIPPPAAPTPSHAKMQDPSQGVARELVIKPVRYASKFVC
jgi:hypothetical protein